MLHLNKCKNFLMIYCIAHKQFFHILFDSCISIRLVNVRISSFSFFFLYRQSKCSLIYSSAPTSYSFVSVSDKIQYWTWQSALQPFSMQGVCVFFRKGIAEKLHSFFPPSKPISIAVVWVTPTPCPFLTKREVLFLRPDSEMVAACTKTAAAPLGTDSYRRI